MVGIVTPPPKYLVLDLGYAGISPGVPEGGGESREMGIISSLPSGPNAMRTLLTRRFGSRGSPPDGLSPNPLLQISEKAAPYHRNLPKRYRRSRSPLKPAPLERTR